MKKTSAKDKKSTIQIIGIVLLSLVTATSVYVYTSGIETRVRSQQDLIPTLIVGRTIPVGMSLSEAFSSGMIEIRQIPRQSLPSLAIRGVTGANGPLVALDEMQPGQFVTTPNFGTKATSTSSLPIPLGMVAMTVTIGEPEKVATFLQPGSEIAIFVTGQSTITKTQITKLLFPQISVLAIGSQIIANTSGVAPATSSGIITVAVSPAQAIKLIHAVRTATLYFALRSDNAEFSQLAPVTDADIIG
jgi:pilus assembly protein CpaB